MFTKPKKEAAITSVRTSKADKERYEIAALRCGYRDISEFVRDALDAYTLQANRLYHSKLAKLIDRAKTQGAISERAMLRADLTALDSKICEIMHSADIEAMPLVVERNAVARRLNALDASNEATATRSELDEELREFERVGRPVAAQ